MLAVTENMAALPSVTVWPVGWAVMFGVVTVEPPLRLSVTVPPLARMVPLLVSMPLQFSEEPDGTVRVSPAPMVRSFCNSTVPYTVPVLPSKTMPLLLLPVGVGVGSVSEIFNALIPPFLASTIAFSLTVRLVVALAEEFPT